MRVTLATDGKSLTLVLRRGRFSFLQKPERYRISADVETFIHGAWLFKIVKCKRLWHAGMMYSHELDASVTADGVLDFLIAKAILCIPAQVR